MQVFTTVELYTAADGRARFREAPLPYDGGKPQALLTANQPCRELQWRWSPPGFESAFHCTETPQWVVVVAGRMEIALQDGSSRVFGPGEHFRSADVLPPGVAFDAAVHGHRSRALDGAPLQTLFVR